MNVYYVSHYRVREMMGTVTPSVLGVYKIRAFTLDELEAKARKAISTMPTYEYLKYSRQPPKGHEVREIE